jgi:copper homeostasis protein
MPTLTYEICIDSVDGAAAAELGGAQRVELCDNLVEGGTTPSIGTIRLARRTIAIGLNVIIRPRGGDFCYTPLEYEVMAEDIRAAKDAGADGVVIGLLLPDGRVDCERTARLVELARPLSVTFHRAIDLCRDSSEALEDLACSGVDRILTSGRKPGALEGAECIAGLVRQSAGRVVIMAGGGVTAVNLPALLAATGVTEVHFSARSPLDSPMVYRLPGVFMGKAYVPEEYSRRVTRSGLVRQVIEAGERAAR